MVGWLVGSKNKNLEIKHWRRGQRCLITFPWINLSISSLRTSPWTLPEYIWTLSLRSPWTLPRLRPSTPWLLQEQQSPGDGKDLMMHFDINKLIWLPIAHVIPLEVRATPFIWSALSGSCVSWWTLGNRKMISDDWFDLSWEKTSSTRLIEFDINDWSSESKKFSLN